MSGGKLPYHLRVRKDIERRLFVEQLRLISKVYDLEEYAYVGMAGPFSEDFKLMYDRFNFKHFFSYEIDEDVYKRQFFNIPFSQVHYLDTKISEFTNDYPDVETEDGTNITFDEVVIWLDYTGLRFEFLDDFETSIGTLSLGSIVKITLLTHASQIYSNNDELPDVRNQKRVDKIKELIGMNYFLEDVFVKEKMTEKHFPMTVFELLKKVSVRALEGSSRKFLPISSYIYQDGMTMLTFTGIIIEEEQEDDFLRKTGLGEWEYGLIAHPQPLRIEVPFLSLKEKFNLDACLPDAPGAELEYFEEEEFKSYEKFYKFYPTYAKIV